MCLYLKYERTGAHLFSNENSFKIMLYIVADPGIFKTGVRSQRVRVLGLGFVLMLLHTYMYLTFLFLRIVKKYILNIDCRLQLNYMRVTQSKLKKNKPQQNFKRGRGTPGAPVWIHLRYTCITNENNVISCVHIFF